MEENVKVQYSNRVEDVIRLSREEALRLGHDYIGTEHLLLGVIREGEGIAVKILRNLGVDFYKLKKTIETEIRPFSSLVLTIGNLPLTKQGEKVLKISYLEARLYRAEFIGTEHLLFSILRNDDGKASEILNNFGVTYDLARRELDGIISGKPIQSTGSRITITLTKEQPMGRKVNDETYSAHRNNAGATERLELDAQKLRKEIEETKMACQEKVEFLEKALKEIEEGQKVLSENPGMAKVIDLIANRVPTLRP